MMQNSVTISGRHVAYTHVRVAYLGDVAAGRGHVDEARVDEGLDLARLVGAQRVRDDLEGHERRVALLEHHERRRTQLVALLLVQDHLDQQRVHLRHATQSDRGDCRQQTSPCSSDWITLLEHRERRRHRSQWPSG